ncbi:peptidase M1 [Tenacibaculum holothuriorum]|uniref:Peptidase M1 n=1 Tax=Tenacibaculum holothuriorum TaxID=1635173 RepID=A0A1Y2PH17_9FLAO|nr:M1 family aminopeptidase [Tenacibaculum holothuriorum]OSY89291.1 peptidase M1 [Tenacibaculum holothuriorum]
MWYEIFKFELNYRIKRPETYMFFVFLLTFSIFGVDFIFQGAELGLMKKNAPLVIAKTMGAITGLFMIMVSMIMGVPILRDYQYDTEALLFINPITKRDYLLGRFLGSFVILIFIFSGLLFGMMLGSQMPWHKAEEMLAFNAITYIQSFVVIVIPTLFFGASTFFVTGMLSKKLLVVYTQGVVMFVLFLLTKAITNEYLQGVMDPFSLTTLTQFSKDWSPIALNDLSITLSGIILSNKLFWSGLGCLIMVYGYHKFSFSTLSKKPKTNKNKLLKIERNQQIKDVTIPAVSIYHNFKAQCIQLYELTKFYTLSLLKETSFWAIAICGILIILINSVNLGTVYGVDSYPKTYFIIEELQEMSMFFFIIVLLFYSGELIWKERTIKQHVLNDATLINNTTTLTSKFIALTAIYIVLMLTLIITGIGFQISKGYYEFQLGVYFSGFFIEILPFLILYTIVAFFFQVLSKNKFIGIFLTLIFFIANIATEFLGFNHNLYKFGGKPLGIYSEMNDYGHFLASYLWTKSYWFVFGALLLILSALLMHRGTENKLWKRIKTIKHQITKPIAYTGIALMSLFLMLGSYIFYNTNIINTYWTNAQEISFRANYEKTLKTFEYIPQPKITHTDLKVELYPETRSYEIEGTYVLKNTTDKLIDKIHVQKRIASHVVLENVTFEGGATANSEYQEFDYTIYKLSKPLVPEASLKMEFKQTYYPKGFENDNHDTEFVYNGTSFNNLIFPSLGYNRNYELNDNDIRQEMNLKIRQSKANIDNKNELVNARSGSDSDGTYLNIIIGTNNQQKAITSGKLIKEWTTNNRNYYHYKTEQPVINFYSILSAAYEVKRDQWTPLGAAQKPVNLEIYHHPKHNYNLKRMMDGMKASLSYYSKNFSPYQYKQLRIMEFPRYAEYAQSLPGIIPFSEALGFVLDINDETDVDMVFYVTAHEVAHQWFGMQIEAANVQGKNFVLETLAQYGAIMVLKEHYPKEKVDQFLEMQQEDYNTKRKKAKFEPSLMLVGNQDYIYYNKGVITMYKLQQLIGEEQVNLAIKRFIEDWDTIKGKLKIKTNRYATSQDLLSYFREVIPESHQYIIHDLFEKVKPMKLE